MKFIPIGVMAVSLVSGYTLLQARVSTAENKISDINKDVETQQTQYYQINVAQVQLQSKLDQSFEILKDLKDSVKEMKKS